LFLLLQKTSMDRMCVNFDPMLLCSTRIIGFDVLFVWPTQFLFSKNRVCSAYDLLFLAF
jgi:hypothetical protein